MGFLQQNGTGGSPLAGGGAKKSTVTGMSVANLTFFTYATIMISLWQAVLYLGSRYYSVQDSYVTHSEFDWLNEMIHTTRMNDQNANLNATATLSNQIESLESSILILKEDTMQSRQLSEERVSEIRRILEKKVRQGEREMDKRMRENQAEIMKAIDSLLGRLKALELAGSALEGSLGEHRSHFQELTKNLQQVHRSFGDRFSELADRANQLKKRLSSHLSTTMTFLPLKDMSHSLRREAQGHHSFMSTIIGRGRREGPPELFYMPSNLTGGRLLCLRGNNTSNGTLNAYSFAFQDGLPPGAVVLPGTTLVSETYWDYRNPWHAMYNLAQFVHWRMSNNSSSNYSGSISGPQSESESTSSLSCRTAQRLTLYHLAELRTGSELGDWIKNVFRAAALPTEPETLSYDNRPVCFEKAVVSRIGIGGVPGWMMGPVFDEIRCTSRRMCGVSFDDVRSGPTVMSDKVRITILARSGTRGFLKLKEWEDAVDSKCSPQKGCLRTTAVVSNLTFCEQVKVMSKTDILITVHGAQLTNMVFMSPGARVMEMFPRGWGEFAGHGQYIYSHLATWVGQKHEGYWRDLHTGSKCPTPSNAEDCFTFYKDQSIGINSTHISGWVGKVIADFTYRQAQALLPPQKREDPRFNFKWDNATCVC